MNRLRRSADEILALVPAAFESYIETRDTVLRSGVVDQSLKELCYRFLAGDPAIVDREHFDARERASLDWAHAIAFDSDRADDELWSRLRALFTEPELVDLGCAIGFELGHQHWRRTLGLPARDDA